MCFQGSKKDVFKIREYFLACIRPIILLQVCFSLYSPQYLPVAQAILLVVTFFSFEEIVVKKNDIQEKLGKKRQGRFLSTQMKSTSARMKTKLISVTWMRYVT